MITFPFELRSPAGCEEVLVEAELYTKTDFCPRAGREVSRRHAEIFDAVHPESGASVSITRSLRSEMERAALAWEVP